MLKFSGTSAVALANNGRQPPLGAKQHDLLEAGIENGDSTVRERREC
jgi:hypothetical protein